MVKRSNKPEGTPDKPGKTRVMFVAYGLGIGGAERVVATLIEHLDKSQFVVCLVLIRDICEFQIPGDIQVFRLHEKTGILNFVRLALELARLIKVWKPNVVLSSWIYANIVSVVARAISRVGYKLILIEHDVHSAFVPNHKETGARLFYKWLPRWMYGLADKIVCVSNGAAMDTQAYYRLKKDKIQVIYDPVDIEKVTELSRCELEHPWFIDKKLPVIAYVGRLAPEKRVDFLLRAFAELIQRIPCRLVIIGQSKAEFSLRALAHSLQLDDCVDFAGKQSNPFKFMARSDLLVVSSLYESFGIVILEAMSCGIPVVSTDCTGPHEIIKSGENGILVPCNDISALAMALETVLTDKKLSAKIALNGRNSLEEFDVKRIIKQYERLLKN
jgi:glycosyltransferase involved in cell wall biosynthesis